MARFATLFNVESPPMDSGSGAGTTVIQRFPRGAMRPTTCNSYALGFQGVSPRPRDIQSTNREYWGQS